MIIAALIVAESLAHADRANSAFVQCLFATSRTARAQALTPEQFTATLSRSCLSEQSAARAAAVSILIARGQPQDQAESSMEKASSGARQAVIRGYSYGTPAKP